MVTFAACSNNEKHIDKEHNPTAITLTKEKDENTPTEEGTPAEEIKNVAEVRISGKSIYVDCSNPYRIKKKTCSAIMYESNDWLVG